MLCQRTRLLEGVVSIPLKEEKVTRIYCALYSQHQERLKGMRNYTKCREFIMLTQESIAKKFILTANQVKRCIAIAAIQKLKTKLSSEGSSATC